LAKRRLLIVDDEQDITFLLCAILQESGFEVVSFNDPLLALQHFKPSYYDLVILDIRMPEMNGFELYRQIKREDNQVKVAFLQPLASPKSTNNTRKKLIPNQAKDISLQNQYQMMS
jgi:DNA-binding response OmpR family regulator